MKKISNIECEKWCRSRGIVVNSSTSLTFSDDNYVSDGIRLPRDFLKSVALIVSLTTTFEGLVRESLLWFTEWGMWSEDTEDIGLVVWQSLRGGFSSMESLVNLPGHVFEGEEVAKVRSLLLLPVVFQWDAQIISGDGTVIVSISHDGDLRLCAQELHGKQLRDWTKEWT